RPLLTRGPDSSRTWEGHSRWSSCSVTAFEWPQGYLSAATGWSASPLHSRGLTISSSNPTSFAVGMGGRFPPGPWQSSLSRALLGTPRAVEDHAMQSAAFQGRASCIKDSAAFSFDEPQGSTAQFTAIGTFSNRKHPQTGVKIVNRKKLEDSACECYGVIQQYDGELGLR